MCKRIVSLQLALFFKELMRDPAPYAQLISSYFDEFNGAAAVMMRAGATIEYQNQNKTYKHAYSLNIAQDRLDYVAINLRQDDDIVKNNFLDLAKKILEKVSSDKELVRIGLISTLFKKSETPINSIKKSFFSSDFNDELNELSFRQNKKFSFNGIETNHIYSNDSIINIDILGEVQSGIIVRHDINTTLVEKGIPQKILINFFDANITSLFEG